MPEIIKILLAEDESTLGQIIKESLETRKFKVFLTTDGNQAYELFLAKKPQLIVLDVMMPKKDGFTLAKEIRQIDSLVPIIFLTAKSQTKDVVEGFGIGGNDYLKKPFSMEELIVRIHNLLNRNISSENNINIGKYKFNINKQTLIFGSITQKLTSRESELLFYLCKNRNQILDRSYILRKLWGDDDFFNARSMDVFITKLRKKLKYDESIEILNIRGYGYKIVY